MDPVILCCAALPFIVILIRKCRQLTWGWCNDESILTNKCFIVTGANSGIGKETVKALVKRKARVIMGCRDIEKAREVIREIRRTISTGELVPMELDLASLKSIRHFAVEVIRDFPQIHVLINNAGVAVPPLREYKTKEGFEINMGVNHIGHFYLTKLLLQKLKDSAPSRIIIVSSKLHEKGEIDFDNLLGEHGYDGVRNRNPAYNNAKLANVYFCRELAKRLPADVETFAVCPGLCFTRLMRHAGIKWFQYIMLAPVALFFLRSAEQGSQTVLHCALSNDVIGHSGKIFRDCKLYHSSHKFDNNIQEKLWRVTDRLINKYI
ncbi:unnamed protein product [Nezara viridula]|uniref:Uncharacterized protein n=1 Tax=Nezara viridula TaxID=85310 RepID=A0A9P0H6H5_NEZVI|nr:unnamed protein product [Nezara viridula]